MKILQNGRIIASISCYKEIGEMSAAQACSNLSISQAKKIPNWIEIEFETSPSIPEVNLTVISPDGLSRPLEIKSSESTSGGDYKYRAVIS